MLSLLCLLVESCCLFVPGFVLLFPFVHILHLFCFVLSFTLISK